MNVSARVLCLRRRDITIKNKGEKEMKCVNCGSEYEGKFCPECGTKTQEPAPTPSMTEQQVNFQRQKVNQPLEAGKKGRKKLNKPKKPIYKKWWFYVIIGIALISIIGAVASGKKTEKIKWNEMVLSAQLPEPAANKGKIHENTSETLDIEVENISGSQYADYVAASKEKGFTTDAKSTSYSYRAYNFDGYCLNLTYNDSLKSLSIKLQKPMEMSEISWPASNAGNQLPVPESTVGKFSYEHDDDFYVYIGNTSKESYNNYVKACSEKGFTVDYDKGDDYYRAKNSEGWSVSIKYEGFNIMSIDIDKPSGSSTDSNVTATAAPETAKAPDETKANDTQLVNGMRKDFKEAMDSYEAFMNEYVEFMKKYQSNPNDTKLLADYAKYMSKYADMCDKFDKWESQNLNAAEQAYYIDVQARVSKKLLEVSNA